MAVRPQEACRLPCTGACAIMKKNDFYIDEAYILRI